MFEFMRHVDSETTFLAREPGEFEASFSLESEAALLKSWSAGEDKLFLVAETKSGEIAGNLRLYQKHRQAADSPSGRNCHLCETGFLAYGPGAQTVSNTI